MCYTYIIVYRERCNRPFPWEAEKPWTERGTTGRDLPERGSRPRENMVGVNMVLAQYPQHTCK